MKKLIVVSDWASDSLTCQEVKSAVEGHLPISVASNISFVASTPSTIHTSFLMAQIITGEEKVGRAKNTVLFQNTDARIQTKKGVSKSRGAEFIILKLKSGAFVCGPNAGYDFSLLKEKVLEIYICKNKSEGSQFRSRDLYSEIAAKLMEDKLHDLDIENASIDIIPDYSGSCIVHIDNYGNIKTNITLSDFLKKHAYNTSLLVKINTVSKKALFVDNLFGAAPGVLVIYPGSSGKRENPYLEISIRRSFSEKSPMTGKDIFKSPRPGDRIFIKM